MRMCQTFLVLLITAVAVSDAVSAPTADEWSKLTSRGLDQEAGTDIDGDRMLRARDESADETGEERISTELDAALKLGMQDLTSTALGISTSARSDFAPAIAHLHAKGLARSTSNGMNPAIRPGLDNPSGGRTVSTSATSTTSATPRTRVANGKEAAKAAPEPVE